MTLTLAEEETHLREQAHELRRRARRIAPGRYNSALIESVFVQSQAREIEAKRRQREIGARRRNERRRVSRAKRRADAARVERGGP